MEGIVINEILEATYMKVSPTLINGIKRQLDSYNNPHDCAMSICDYLGIEYRENRANVRRVLEKHDYFKTKDSPPDRI